MIYPTTTVNSIVKSFNFLIDELDFRIVNSKQEEWGCEIIFMNDKVAVKLIYEYREAYLFVNLCKVKSGIVLNNAGYDLLDVINCIGLDDIVNLKCPNDLLKSQYEYENQLTNNDKTYLDAHALNLKKYGFEVLEGDFKIFSPVSKIIKKRYRSHN